MNNVQELTRKLVWGLAGLSLTSCLVRNDFNVLFAFLILIILNRYYVENPKFYTKIIVHILVVLVIADIFWMIIIMPYWNSDIKNDAWKRLSGIHSFVIFLAFIQLILKGGILGILGYDYKQKNPENFMELTNLSYNMSYSKPKENVIANQGGANININVNPNS